MCVGGGGGGGVSITNHLLLEGAGVDFEIQTGQGGGGIAKEMTDLTPPPPR